MENNHRHFARLENTEKSGTTSLVRIFKIS